jgi:hypothetical protein
MSLTAARPATVPIVERRPIRLWSPAQVIALVLGVAAIVFGVIALARTGVDFSHLTQSHERVFGFGHTPLLGLAELGFGFLLILGALFPIVGRNLMTLVGAATLGLGVVVVGGWWSAKMLSWLGAGDRDGWLLIGAGGFVLLTSFFTPVFTWGGPRVVRRPAPAEPETEAPPESATEASAEPEPAADATEPVVTEPKPREEPDVPSFVAGAKDGPSDADGEPPKDSEPTKDSQPSKDSEPSKDPERAPVDVTHA